MGLCEILLGNTCRVRFNLTKLCRIALQKGCSWQYSRQHCMNPFHTADNLQLSNSESLASQLFSSFHNSASSCYCFTFISHLVLHGSCLAFIFADLLYTPHSFSLMASVVFCSNSVSWQPCLYVLLSNTLIVLQSLFSLAHFGEVNSYPGPLPLTDTGSDINSWRNQMPPC